MTRWIQDRGLTLTLLAIFLACWLGEIRTGWAWFNDEARRTGHATLAFGAYMRTGHPWEATFENWESEFLEMAAFVMLTVVLVQRGSAESRRPGVVELVDADPRSFADAPDAPWPVKRGGFWLWCYERSLGLAFVACFVAAWTGHLLTGWRAEIVVDALHGLAPPSFGDYLVSSGFWFQSFQNWQSEFLGVASMVWLSVYLRQRGSPESKPVHAAHRETGR